MIPCIIHVIKCDVISAKMATPIFFLFNYLFQNGKQKRDSYVNCVFIAHILRTISQEILLYQNLLIALCI